MGGGCLRCNDTIEVGGFTVEDILFIKVSPSSVRSNPLPIYCFFTQDYIVLDIFPSYPKSSPELQHKHIMRLVADRWGSIKIVLDIKMPVPPDIHIFMFQKFFIQLESI